MQACCLEVSRVAGAWRECDFNDKKGNYREGCTYLRREEVNIINKLCSLEMLLRYEVLYIQPKSQEWKLRMLMASLRNIILLIMFTGSHHCQDPFQ